MPKARNQKELLKYIGIILYLKPMWPEVLKDMESSSLIKIIWCLYHVFQNKSRKVYTSATLQHVNIFSMKYMNIHNK